jgi:hypothetical protein
MNGKIAVGQAFPDYELPIKTSRRLSDLQGIADPMLVVPGRDGWGGGQIRQGGLSRPGRAQAATLCSSFG